MTQLPSAPLGGTGHAPVPLNLLPTWKQSGDTPLAAGENAGATPLALIAMPWPPIYSPYLALSTLAACAAGADDGRTVTQHHLYLYWYSQLLKSYGDETSDLYSLIAEAGAYAGLGDFIFTCPRDDEAQTISAYATTTSMADKLPLLTNLIGDARTFVENQAQELAVSLPGSALVGFSSTFTQTGPSLALARQLKLVRPDVTICLGGSNMNPSRADVLLRNYAFIDHIAYGEGEQSLVRLLRNLDAGRKLETVPGIVSRGQADTASRCAQTEFINLDDWPAPDFDPYFEQLSTSKVDSVIEPKLAYEIARGCWWGEKHHCTFCGLNGDSMLFRRKSTEKALLEITALITRHCNLDVIFADNILHPTDIAAIFDKLPRNIDLRMHLEVKSNMRRSEIQALRDAGVWHLQPGIESLARRPLEIMRKGVTPQQNVRFLRNAEELGVTVSWNILTGFPGEQALDYSEMLRQLRNLRHLQPPGSVAPLALVRYSPLFNEPSLGFEQKCPAPFNRFLYGVEMSEDDVEIMSEVFDGTAADLDSEDLACANAELNRLVDAWHDAYAGEFLIETECSDAISITRVTNGVTSQEVTLTEMWAVAAWNQLRPGRTQKGIDSYLRSLPDDVQRLVEEMYEDLEASGLLWRDGGLITLPARYESHIPHRLLG